jgi:hypothetical protein
MDDLAAGRAVSLKEKSFKNELDSQIENISVPITCGPVGSGSMILTASLAAYVDDGMTLGLKLDDTSIQNQYLAETGLTRRTS